MPVKTGAAKAWVCSVAAVVACLVAWPAGARAEDAAAPAAEAAQQPANPIVLWELATHDCHKSAEFFRTVFGWQTNFAEDVQYYRLPIADGESQLSGGIIFTLAQAKLPFLALYILVDDIEAKAEAVTTAGGLITEPPHEISPGVSICLFNEPSGCTFAMIQIKPKE